MSKIFPGNTFILEEKLTIYIRPDGTIDPPSTPITVVGNVYTLAGNLNETLIIQKDNLIIDGNNYTIQGTGVGYGIYLSGRTGITIRNVAIKNFTYGVYLYSSSGNTITETVLSENYWGINMLFSHNNTIIKNKIESNIRDGIGMGWYSGRNRVSSNTVCSNGSVGIVSYDWPWYNLFTDNLIYSNGTGIVIGWNYHSTIEKNIVFQNSYAGIYGDTTHNCIFKNNLTYSNGSGLLLSGIGAYNNTIMDNVSSSNQIGVDIHWEWNRYNLVSENVISNNREIGIRLLATQDNVIKSNIIENNMYGVGAVSVSGRIVRNNIIYHNDFIDNTVQATDDGINNAWDNGYPSGGSYWSDYIGVDNYSGPNQDQPGSDGFGDTPYFITGIAGSKDRYPSMKPWRWVPPIIMATVDIDPDTLNLGSKRKWITGYIELPSEYNVSDIKVDTVKLNSVVPAETKPTEIGDYDKDGIPDLMVKFDRSTVEQIVSTGNEVKITVSGSLRDEKKFAGSDTIKVISPPSSVITSVPSASVNSLGQNYPNPFNPATTIEYAIEKDCQVTIKLYNVAGQEVAILVDEWQSAGPHKIVFDAGEKLSRGIYYYQMKAGSFVDTKKMVVLK